MLLHVVHDNTVVSRKATSVVLVVHAVMLPEGEELLHDDSLRKEYGEVCE